MKLDTSALRYLSGEDWRVLTAVEQGSKNHEVVPTPLIQQIAGSKISTGVHRCISNLAKVGLIAKVRNARYDGYRLTYGGIDYLALNTHRKGNVIFSLGNQIGVGKESDIYVVADPEGRQLVLKLHRLGRISFRTVKSNRDYLRNRSTGSWMYLSKLAAQKEHAFMRVLYREGYPIPEPVGWNRHTVVMEFIDSFPLRMIDNVPHPEKLYADLMELIIRLAHNGLIHGDFNEFNILIKETPAPTTRDPEAIRLQPILIDFPQTLSTSHENAEFYFDRDVACVKRFFERRFKYTSDEPGPFMGDVLKGAGKSKRLDVEVEATGFSRKMAKELDRYVERTGELDNADKLVNGLNDESDASDVDSVGSNMDKASEGNSDNGSLRSDGLEGAHDLCKSSPDLGATTAAVPMQRSDEVNSQDQGRSLTLDRFLQGNDGNKDWGLKPIDITSASDIAVERVKLKKQATGWSI